MFFPQRVAVQPWHNIKSYMNKFKYLIIAALAVFSTTATATAQTSAENDSTTQLVSELCVVNTSDTTKADNSMEEWFKSDAAEKVLPYVDRTNRLDMVDYYNAGLFTPRQDAYYSDDISLVLLDSRTMRLKDPTMTIDVTMVTPENSDTLIVVVETLPLRGGESTVRVYTADGEQVKNAIKMPTYSDWLEADIAKTLSESALLADVPFVTATAKVDHTTGTLTFSNTATLIAGIPEKTACAFKPTLTYVLKNKKYTLKH